MSLTADAQNSRNLRVKRHCTVPSHYKCSFSVTALDTFRDTHGLAKYPLLPAGLSHTSAAVKYTEPNDELGPLSLLIATSGGGVEHGQRGASVSFGKCHICGPSNSGTARPSRPTNG